MTFHERFADNERTIVYGDDGDDKHSIQFWDDHKPTSVVIQNPHDLQNRVTFVNGEEVYGNGKELPDFAALDIFARVRTELGE